MKPVILNSDDLRSFLVSLYNSHTRLDWLRDADDVFYARYNKALSIVIETKRGTASLVPVSITISNDKLEARFRFRDLDTASRAFLEDTVKGVMRSVRRDEHALTRAIKEFSAEFSTGQQS